MKINKPIKFSSRLHLNRYGVYGFRLIIPKNFKCLFIQNEYRISLKTRNKDVAKAHSFKLTALVQVHFERIRMAINFEDEHKAALELVQSLQIQDFDNHINFLENLYEFDSGENKQTLLELINLRKRDNEYKQQIEALLEEHLKNLSSCSESKIDSITNDFYTEVTSIKQSQWLQAQEINRFTLGLQSAVHSKVNLLNLQEVKKEFDSDKEKLRQFTSDLIAKAYASSPNSQQHSNPTEADSNKSKTLLSEVVKEYSIHQKAEGKWTAKTENTVKEIFELWIRIVGDMPIEDYDFEKNRKFKAVLQKLPANINKSPKYRNKTIDEILELDATPAASHTINKKLARVSSLFDWANQYGHATVNPAKGMTIKSPKSARDVSTSMQYFPD